MNYDIFIAHASEDKTEVARPIAELLQNKGLSVWYDEFILSPGDSLSREIDRGLAETKYGLVVLSPSFFQKFWTQRELAGLIIRESQYTEKLIIPIWHNVTIKEVLNFSPPLADKIAISTSQGISEVVSQVETVIRSSSKFRSFANSTSSNHFESSILNKGRDWSLYVDTAQIRELHGRISMITTGQLSCSEESDINDFQVYEDGSSSAYFSAPPERQGTISFDLDPPREIKIGWGRHSSIDDTYNLDEIGGIELSGSPEYRLGAFRSQSWSSIAVLVYSSIEFPALERAFITIANQMSNIQFSDQRRNY